MRRLAIALAASLMAVPVAVSAQTAPSARVDARTSLDCAMWAAILAGQSDDKAASEALTFTMTWFLGRFEGLTGQRFDTSVSDRDLEGHAMRIEELNGICLPLMEDIGNRMAKWGDAKAGDPKRK